MAKCDTCGNDYDKTFQIQMNGSTYHFDCFECATHKLAPVCGQCGVRVLGHGLEHEGRFYCCKHCAETAGVAGMCDRT